MTMVQRWKGKVQEQQKVPHYLPTHPSITLSIYIYLFMPLSFPLVSPPAANHVLTVIILWDISLCMEEHAVWFTCRPCVGKP